MAKIKKSVGEVNGKQKEALDVGDGTKLMCRYDVDLMELLSKARYEKLVYGIANNKNNFVADWVDAEFDSIKKGLRKDSDTALRSQRQFASIIKETQDYFDSKKALDSDFIEYQLYKKLFAWQQEVMRSQSKRKCLICSRRTGKTYMEAFEMVKHCLKGYDEIKVDERIIRKPRCACYIGLTLQRAASLMWDNLKQIVADCRIPTTHIDNGLYRIDFANGAYLKLEGNSSTAERNKIRGSDWSMAIVDECQNQASLAYLFDSILNPIVSPRNGTIIFSGTGPLVRGYWSDVIDGTISGWEKFHYTIFDNPTIENPAEVLKTELERLGGNENNPVYKREWLGEICWDDNLLIYPKVLHYEQLPQDFRPTSFWGGIDYGFRDSTAVLGFLVDDFGQCYLVSEWKQAGSNVTTIYNQVKAMLDSIKSTWQLADDKIHLVADTNEQMVSQEFYNRGITQIENAYKSDERQQIAVLNEALASGRLLVKKDSEVAYEATVDSYKWDEEHQRVIFEEDTKVFHADALDALRYAYFNYYQTLLIGA